ncbi:helix-turn-helix domain-containing protein [Dactylosporangium sp. CA-092794]|uniref:helix-turn-helix domain-containing protein n=1 Tax=Dactylosporangium sp. CA-092794 TaxID=3239929 RepID=UPI003D92B467
MHLSAGDRFEFWRETLSRQAIPVVYRTRYPRDFVGVVQAADFGPVRVVATKSRPVDAERTPALIRRSDPEVYLVLLNHKGGEQLEQDGRVTVMSPWDMVLLHSSHPFRTTCDPDGPTQHGTVVMLEPGILPIPARRLRDLVGLPLSTGDSLDSLVSQYILGLGAGRFQPADAGRLTSATVSLVSLMLARRLNSVRALPGETREDALLARVREHIIVRLGDPTLTPESVAAAHHISVRTLHRLFQANEVTVAGWIRQRRLERCHADLLDPALVTRSVRSIARRWGFPDAAHFSRVFQNAYGSSPAAFRAQHAFRPSN